MSHPSESLWHIRVWALARTLSDSCEWDISRMNGPCFTWIHHVAYMNESCHIWVSHVTCEWHVTYERVTWQGETSPVPDDLLRISVGIEHAKDLIADLEAAASDWMSHGPPQWVKLHMDESWHISMSYIAYGWVYQKSEVVLQKMIWRYMDSTDYYESIFFSSNNFLPLFSQNPVVQIHCLFYSSLSVPKSTWEGSTNNVRRQI